MLPRLGLSLWNLREGKIRTLHFAWFACCLIPLWIDGALRRAVAPSAARRYDALSEFVYDLKHPNPRFLQEGPRGLIERNPIRFWQCVAAGLAALELLTLWWLL